MDAHLKVDDKEVDQLEKSKTRTKYIEGLIDQIGINSASEVKKEGKITGKTKLYMYLTIFPGCTFLTRIGRL